MKFKRNKQAINRLVSPYELLSKDPDTITPRDKDKSKSNKTLTNLRHWSTLKSVNKHKRKGDKMADDKQKSTNLGSASYHLKTNGLKGPEAKELLAGAGWLLEAVFRSYVGWMLLLGFHDPLATVAAVYALVTAGLVVAGHFFKAHRIYY